MKKLVYVLLVTLLVTVTVLYFQTQSAYAQKQTFSGEEIFRGFVFGQGNVAKKIPELFNKSQLKEWNSKDAIEGVNQLIEKIKSEDPIYFKELQSAVYSKDPVKVDQLLTEGGQLVKKLIPNYSGDTSVKFVKSSVGWEI